MSNSNIYSNQKIFVHKDWICKMKQDEQPNPICVYLIASDLCNLSCGFCPYRKDNNPYKALYHTDNKSNPARFLEINKIKEIVNDCKEMGVKAIELTGGGEPTMHPHFEETLELITNSDIDVGLITNGILLFTKTTPELILKCRWVRISVDAASPETYGVVKGTSEHIFSKVADTVKTLAEAKKRTNSTTTVGVGFVVTKNNYHEIYKACGLYKSWGADYIRICMDFSEEAEKYWPDIRLEANQFASSGKTDFQDDHFSVINNLVQKEFEKERGISQNKLCPTISMRTFIGADQNVYLCCVRAYTKSGIIGSLKETSFKDLWSSKNKKKRFNNFDSRECGACPYYTKNLIVNDCLLRNKVVPPVISSPHDNFV